MTRGDFYPERFEESDGVDETFMINTRAHLMKVDVALKKENQRSLLL